MNSKSSIPNQKYNHHRPKEPCSYAQPSAKSAVNQLLSAVQMFASAVFSLFPLLSAFFSDSNNPDYSYPLRTTICEIRC